MAQIAPSNHDLEGDAADGECGSTSWRMMSRKGAKSIAAAAATASSSTDTDVPSRTTRRRGSVPEDQLLTVTPTTFQTPCSAAAEPLKTPEPPKQKRPSLDALDFMSRLGGSTGTDDATEPRKEPLISGPPCWDHQSDPNMATAEADGDGQALPPSSQSEAAIDTEYIHDAAAAATQQENGDGTTTSSSAAPAPSAAPSACAASATRFLLPAVGQTDSQDDERLDAAATDLAERCGSSAEIGADARAGRRQSSTMNSRRCSVDDTLTNPAGGHDSLENVLEGASLDKKVVGGMDNLAVGDE